MRKTLYIEEKHDDWIKKEVKRSGRSYQAVIRRVIDFAMKKEKDGEETN